MSETAGYVVLVGDKGDIGTRSHMYAPRGPLSKPYTACGRMVFPTDRKESSASLPVCRQCERRKP